MQGVTSVVISCKQRAGELAKTEAQLVKLGIYPHVLRMPCDPPSIEGNLWGAYVACMTAEANGNGLLFLEDDIDVKPSMEQFLAAAVEFDHLTTFILFRDSLYPPGFEANQRLEGRRAAASLVRLEDHLVGQRRGWHGSQAVYLPPRAVRAVLDDHQHFVKREGAGVQRLEPGPKRDGFDFWIKEHAVELGGLYCAYPNPVQHRNDAPSTFSGKVGSFVSLSYRLDPVWS